MIFGPLLVALALAGVEPSADEAGTLKQSIKNLASTEPDVRLREVERLRDAREIDRRVIPALAERLRDPREEIRWTAATALRLHSRHAGAAVPRLIEALGDGELRGLAIDALGGIGAEAAPAVPHLLGWVHSPRYRVQVITALGSMGPGARPAIPFLLDVLGKDVDDANRTAALMALASIGGKDDPQVQHALIRQLRHDDGQFRLRDFRLQVCDAIGTIGPRARGFVAELLIMTDGEDVALRIGAMEALVNIAPGHPAVLRTLARLMDDPDEEVRKAVIRSLEEAAHRTGACLTLLAAGLIAPRNDVKRRAAEALGNLRSDGREALPALRSSLNDPDVLIAVSRAVLDIEPADTQAVEAVRAQLRHDRAAVRLQTASRWMRSAHSKPVLVSADEIYAAVLPCLDDGDPAIRATAVALLPAVRGYARVLESDYFVALLRALGDDDQRVRLTAFKALGGYRRFEYRRWSYPVSGELFKVLIRAGKAPEPEIGAWIAATMVQMAPDDPRAIPTVIEALRHENEQVRQGAVDMLGFFGSEAADAAEPLVELLAKPGKPELRAAIIDALVRIGIDAAAALAVELDNDERAVRLLVLDGLNRLGAKAGPAIPELVEALHRKDKLEAHGAALALGSIGPSAIDELLPLLRENESHIRALAALALGHAGPHARRATADLAPLLTDRVEEVRLRAAEALWPIGPTDADVLTSLVRSLSDGSVHVRRRALDALVRAKERAVPILIKALVEHDAGVRRQAAQALGEIGSKAVAALSALEAAQRDPDASVRAAASAAHIVIQRQSERP